MTISHWHCHGFVLWWELEVGGMEVHQWCHCPRHTLVGIWRHINNILLTNAASPAALNIS